MNSTTNLRQDWDNAIILDFRDVDNPKNTIVFTCEHATNLLPVEYSWSDHDKKYFADEHWSYDPGFNQKKLIK